MSDTSADRRSSTQLLGISGILCGGLGVVLFLASFGAPGSPFPPSVPPWPGPLLIALAVTFMVVARREPDDRVRQPVALLSSVAAVVALVLADAHPLLAALPAIAGVAVVVEWVRRRP